MSLTKDLPPALPSMWRALKRGYDAEPMLLSVSFGLSLLAALPDALLALWFKFLADGVLGGRRGLVATARAAAEHAAARKLGVTGVPAARLDGNEAFVVGALPVDSYRRWIFRQLEP